MDVGVIASRIPEEALQVRPVIPSPFAYREILRVLLIPVVREERVKRFQRDGNGKPFLYARKVFLMIGEFASIPVDA